MSVDNIGQILQSTGNSLHIVRVQSLFANHWIFRLPRVMKLVFRVFTWLDVCDVHPVKKSQQNLSKYKGIKTQEQISLAKVYFQVSSKKISKNVAYLRDRRFYESTRISRLKILFFFDFPRTSAYRRETIKHLLPICFARIITQVD